MGKKGVKKIIWTGEGTVHKDKSKPNHSIVIEGGTTVGFKVGEWYPDTPEADKKKRVTWIRQSENQKVDFYKGTRASTEHYKLFIPKAMAGKVTNYIEASLSGLKDLSRTTGLFVRAQSPFRVVSSYWREDREDNSEQIHIGKPTQYNVPLHLHMELEGLNGYKCTVHIFNCEYNLFKNDDQKIKKTYTATCINGSLDVHIPATDVLQWKREIGAEKPKEHFYVQLTVEGHTGYVKDTTPHGDTKHATHLYINNSLGKLIAKVIPLPKGNKVVTVGEPDKHPIKFKNCKFTSITITDREAITEIFNERKGSTFEFKNKRYPFTLKIHYDTDKSEIRNDAKPIVNNLVEIFKANPHMEVHIESNADERQEPGYNIALTERRVNNLLSYLYTHGVKNKITTAANGEKYAKKLQYLSNKDNAFYQLDRNTQINFRGSTIKTLFYNTIVPSISVPTPLNINVKDFKTQACFASKEANRHNNTKVVFLSLTNDAERVAYKTLPVKGGQLTATVFSDLVPILPVPWLLNPNQFDLRINTCSYFPDKFSPGIIVNAFTDALWMMHGTYDHDGYFFKRNGVAQKVAITKGIETLYHKIESFIDNYLGFLVHIYKAAMPLSFYTNKWLIDYIREDAKLYGLSYNIRHDWKGNSYGKEIPYTENNKAATEVAILTLTLLGIAVEVLIAILTEGEALVQKLPKLKKLARVAKEVNKAKKELEEVGFEFVFPKVGFNRASYFEKKKDGNVYMIWEDNVKADPLIALNFEKEFNLAQLITHILTLEDTKRPEPKTVEEALKQQEDDADKEKGKEVIAKGLQKLLNAAGNDASIKLQYKGSIEAAYQAKFAIPATANQPHQKASITNILKTVFSNTEGKVIGAKTINAEAQLKITQSLKVDEWMPISILKTGLSLDSKAEGAIEGSIAHSRTYGYSPDKGPYYQDVIHFGGIRGKVSLSSTFKYKENDKLDILTPKTYNFTLFEPQTLTMAKIYSY